MVTDSFEECYYNNYATILTEARPTSYERAYKTALGMLWLLRNGS